MRVNIHLTTHILTDATAKIKKGKKKNKKNQPMQNYFWWLYLYMDFEKENLIYWKII